MRFIAALYFNANRSAVFYNENNVTCFDKYFVFDFFDIKFNIPNIRNLDMELQAQSYMYNIAYYLVKGMLFLKKNLKDIPNPQKNYIIKLKCEVNKNE